MLIEIARVTNVDELAPLRMTAREIYADDERRAHLAELVDKRAGELALGTDAAVTRS